MNAVLLRFTLLGPLLGTIAFNVFDLLLTRPLDATSPFVVAIFAELLSAIVWGVAIGVLGLFLGFPLGLLPAFVASAIYWKILKDRCRLRARPYVRALAGALSGFLSATIFGGLFFSRDTSGHLSAALVACWAGAGAVSVWIMGSVGRGKGTRAKTVDE